jgi:hypothetical protein
MVVGDKVRITKRGSVALGHEFKVGEEVEVLYIMDNGSVKATNETFVWWVYSNEYEPLNQEQ